MTFLSYGLRYIAKVLRNTLKAKFQNSSDREILKIIGNLVYYRFINSAICSPDAYDVIDVKAGDVLNTDQRKNLACIAKHLQLISMSKGVILFSCQKKIYMNKFLNKLNKSLKVWRHWKRPSSLSEPFYQRISWADKVRVEWELSKFYAID